ncbi:MAG: zf-HC2 domain-containing protein [Oscillospiraceae bacterium]
MRECNKYQEMISCMTDGELSAHEAEELHAHIDTCPECRLVYEAFLGISGAISEGIASPPEYFAESVMNKFALQKSRKSRKLPYALARYGAIAACLAVILLGAYEMGLFSRAGSGNTADSASMLMEFSAAEAPPAVAAEEQERGKDEAFDYCDGASTGSVDGGQQDKQMVTSAGSGVVEEAPDERVNESAVSLFGMTSAEIYSVSEVSEGDNRPEEELLLVITDEDTLNFLAELLSFSEYPHEKIPQSKPVFVVGVESKDREMYNVNVWVVEGRLWCSRQGSTVPYIAQGSLDDLLKLIAEA